MTLKRASAAAIAAALTALSLAACAPAAESPEDVLTQYLTAISEGKASDALKLVEHANQEDAPLLTDEVLGSAESRISDIQVGKDAAPEGSTYEVNEDGGNIPYAYSLAGETFYGVAPMFKSDDGAWKVDGLPGDGSILGSLSISSDDDEDVLLSTVEIGKGKLALGESSLVFPAVYAPTFIAVEGFEAEAAQPVRITGDDSISEAVPAVEATAETIDKGVEAVKAQLATCSQATVGQTEGCPFSTKAEHYEGWTLAPTQGTWEGTPTLDTSACESTKTWQLRCEFDAESLVFTTVPYQRATGVMDNVETVTTRHTADGEETSGVFIRVNPVETQPVYVDLRDFSVTLTSGNDE